MHFRNQTFVIVRFVMILAFLAGMLGTSSVRSAHAATYIVTNTNADGPGSLAGAIGGAALSGGGTITFDPSLAGQTITFTSQLVLNTLAHVIIDGTGLNPPVMVSGGNLTGLLKINGAANFDISNLVFTQGAAEDGGAIEISGLTNLNLENCTFLQNQATDVGGAIAASGGGKVNIVNSTFDQNQAGLGGALYGSGNTLITIAGSTFSNNSADGNGGAITGGNITVIDSTFQGNTSLDRGGAISAGLLDIVNTTFYRNKAWGGGAIYILGNGTITIVNNTMTQNEASERGGAIFTGGGAATIYVFNSTFAGNRAPTGSEVDLFINIASLHLHNTILACGPGNNSCVSKGFAGSVSTANSIIETGTPASFGLAELADNGGPTQTMALLPHSPLIDAGDDSICGDVYGKSLDQRGVARPQGSHCDIGAYEDQPLVRYVRQDANGMNDGSSWANAHTDLQSALTVASQDEEIWVAAGTYKPTSGIDRTVSFVLKNGVAIYGGFDGMETVRTQRHPEINVTTLSGDIGVQGDNTDNSYHVVVGSNTNHSAILDGFTVTGGNADDMYGGGIYIDKGNPGLNNLVFTSNQARFGGGIYAFNTDRDDITIDLELTNIVFRDNSVSGEGGGMATLFYPSLSGGFRLSLTDIIFENNTAGRTGGGLINNGPELELIDVIFRGNIALGGGGLSNIPTTPSVLKNVTFHNNSASDGGGGMLIGSDGPILSTLTNVTFSNNSTESSGGGIVNAGYSDLLLTNVTFRGNTAGANGGGLFNGGFFAVEGRGTVNLSHTTFSNNAANSGGAVYNESGNINIHNSILYGDAGGEIVNSSGAALVTHSIVQGGYEGTGNLDEDPLLGPLQDNGGFTRTMALSTGSPAIDAADDSNCAETDQRGVARPQGAHCDRGAYEYDKSAIEVTIGDVPMDSYMLPPHESQRHSYPGVNSGPVKIVNTGGIPILAAERVIYKVNEIPTSFSEMMGLPANQLDTIYWLPWYNNVDLDTQLRFVNVSDSTATVHVYVGATEMPGSPFTLLAGESTRKSFPGVNNGPVKIVSDDGVPIVAAERVIYKVNGANTSFSEMMALPNAQLDTIYWLPWYNNKDLDTQLRFANVSDATATVHVYVHGEEMPGSPFTLQAGESVRKSFPAINSGPVKIVSDHGVPIVAAERVIYKINGKPVSFSETMALPDHQLDTTYWFPWYNNVDLETQLRIANTTSFPATVHVYAGETELPGSPFTLAAGESTRKSFAGINAGPVKIVSDRNIIAAERVIYRINNTPTSFSEMMGLSNSLLDTTFWFPWYNNIDLDTQLRFAVP